MISLYYYLTLSALLFVIGAYGMMTQRNAVKILMCVEMMLNAANINLIAFSAYLGDISGQILVTFSIAIAAAEAVIGLAIFVHMYRVYGTIDIGEIGELRRW